MRTIISPHDTAFIRSDPSNRAALVVVDGSARDYLARLEEAQQAPQETARLTRYRRWLAISGILLALGVVGIGAWLMSVDTPTPGVALLGVGLLGMAAAPCVVLSVRIVTGESYREEEIARHVTAVNDQARPISLRVRDSQDAAVDFTPGHSGLFDYVLEAMTPQRRARMRELSKHSDLPVVRQALVLLAQEYEPKHRREQEVLQVQRAAERMRAARALLEPTAEAPERGR